VHESLSYPMLVAKTSGVSQPKGNQIDLWGAHPHGPPDPWITLGLAGVRSFDPDHGQIQRASVCDMQVCPPAQATRPLVVIRPLPRPVRVGVGGRIIGTPCVSVCAWTSSCARVRRSRSRETPMAFHTDHGPRLGNERP
jgi:hypothetical protein